MCVWGGKREGGNGVLFLVVRMVVVVVGVNK